MNKLQLLALVALLASASILATSGLLKSVEAERHMPPEISRPEGVGERPPVRRPHVGDGQVAAISQGLWEKNLFTPERGPRLESPEDESDGAPSGPAEMELTGIGRIGDRQAAIIIVNPGRRRAARGARAPQTAPSPMKKIYVIGDEVGQTGLTLAEITFDKREGISEVVLAEPGGGRQTLRMQTDDPASLNRAAGAVDAQAEQVAQIHLTSPPPEAPSPSARPARDATAPPPPPAPDGRGLEIAPPTPTIPQTTRGGDSDAPDKPVAEMTREERLRWAIEMRRRHLQNREKPNQPR